MKSRLFLILAALVGCTPGESNTVHEVSAYEGVARSEGNLLGGDPVMVDGDCFESPTWSALVSRSSVASENEIYVADEPCVRDPSWAKWTIPIDEATFVAGLHADWLFLDSGTGPDGRDLTVYSLQSGQEIVRTPYVHDELRIDGTSLRFFVPVPTPPATRCLGASDWEAGGLGTGYESEAILDLESGGMEVSDSLTCSPRQ